MSWRELRNAPLIEALLIGLRSMAVPVADSDLRWIQEAWDRLSYLDRHRYRDDILVWNGSYVGQWADWILCALLAYNDMPAIVEQEPEELGAMIRMFPETELAFRCEAAIRLFTVIGKEKAHELAKRLLDSGPAGGVGTEEDVVAAQAAGRESAVPEGEEDA